MLHVSSLLKSSYSSESDIENIMNDCVVEFLEETNFNDFPEFFLNFKYENQKY